MCTHKLMFDHGSKKKRSTPALEAVRDLLEYTGGFAFIVNIK